MNLNQVPGKWLVDSKYARLPFWKRWLLRAWLVFVPGDREALENLDRLRIVLGQQPRPAPSPAVFQRIQARVQSQRQPEPATAGPPVAWLLAAVAAIFGLLLIWQVLPPGVVLEWSVESGAPQIFRVYRAPAGSDSPENAYVLVGQMAAEGDAQAYRYTDMLLLPGQAFTYRVEAVDSSGQTAFSQAVVGRGLDALPGQIMLLAAALIGAYALGQLVHFSWRRWPTGCQT